MPASSTQTFGNLSRWEMGVEALEECTVTLAIPATRGWRGRGMGRRQNLAVCTKSREGSWAEQGQHPGAMPGMILIPDMVGIRVSSEI